MIKPLIYGLILFFAGNADASLQEIFGLYSASDFKTMHGKPCDDCQISPQTAWYFKNELIVVPSKQLSATDLNNLPPLVWQGSTALIPNAKIVDDKTFTIDDGKENSALNQWYFIADKIPTNLSYWNDSTLDFFKNRSIRLRGELTDRGFIARTVWPQDFKLDLNAKLRPLAENESLKSLVQFENGGAKSAYESRLLWGSTTNLNNKAVMAFMLNGAQGDDDEAHGGHFAVVTGRMNADGSYANWLVNNYYNLASNSEKGIIAAPTPLDNYLADLNSGQSYYRPSYMLVAVFKTDRLPAKFQAETNRNYTHFYRNDFVYDHSSANCAGMSIDTLRSLGWDIPTRGVESQLKATAAYFYVAATEMSLTKGRAIYDYLNTETTRLFPAVTFDAIGESVLLGANQWSRKLYLDHNPTTPFMRQFGNEIVAIYFVRIPQIPSSRAFGLAPIYSFDQYMRQAPADRSQWKIVPTTPNPLPEALKDGAALKLDAPSLIPLPVSIVLLLLIGGLTWLARSLVKRRIK